MDTDDLSKETYRAVLVTAAKFHNDLTLKFGLLAYDCDNDDEFLNESEELIKTWLRQRHFQYVPEFIFFDNLPSPADFRSVLEKILVNISNVRQIPIKSEYSTRNPKEFFREAILTAVYSSKWKKIKPGSKQDWQTGSIRCGTFLF